VTNLAVNIAVIILFAAKPVGGSIQCQEGETMDVEWFAFEDLPSPLSLGHQRRIKDAIEGRSGTVVLQEINLPAMPAGRTRKELSERYMRSGLSRREFYLQIVAGAEIKETVEVGMSDL
jgi:hypothetical protein